MANNTKGNSNNNHKADQKNHNNTTLDKNNESYKKAQDNHANQKNPNKK
ncbi:hypothetical protein JXR93_07350 [bacterium]|nr:hypothetical protein [bacterium]